jgi:2-dehydro-3-deoxyphosphogluconate aldolase / (4S)-4-hydroxy-2-oxoglutarate aldolase
MKLDEILSLSPVIPVLTIQRAEDSVPLVRALADGGLKAIEITLRTEAALEAIHIAAAEVPGAIIGAGTILGADDLNRAHEAGARFAVSPGATPGLLEAAVRSGPPLLPGAATASEIMVLAEAGYTHVKFFPAEVSGGVSALRAFAGPFPRLVFCPTGGIGPGNAPSYLALPNVPCVGGSWVAPEDGVSARDWPRITTLAREAAALKGPGVSDRAGSGDRNRLSVPRT